MSYDLTTRERSPWDETTPVLDGFPWADLEIDSPEMRAWLAAHTPGRRALMLDALAAQYDRRGGA